MRSFVPALVVATLASFACAVPITRLPATTPGGDQVLSDVGDVDVVQLRDLPSGITYTIGSIESEMNLRDLTSEAIGAVDSIESELNLRTNVLSVSTVFAAVEIDVLPFTQQLTYLTPSNGTVTEITSLVSSIKTPLETAITQLKALGGQDPSVIFAPVNPTGQNLTVPEIATIVGADINLILGAVGQVLNIVKSEGGIILTDVDNLLEDLGTAVSEVVTVVDGLVDGLAASLAPVLAPVETIITELGLESLIDLIGL